MTTPWTNIQVLECMSDGGDLVTVIRQSNGQSQRYVLGNGDTVMPNKDGSFDVPMSGMKLNVMNVA